MRGTLVCGVIKALTKIKFLNKVTENIQKCLKHEYVALHEYE